MTEQVFVPRSIRTSRTVTRLWTACGPHPRLWGLLTYQRAQRTTYLRRPVHDHAKFHKNQ